MSRIMIVAAFELKPEHAGDFIKLMKNHAELSRAEDGCQQFDVLQAGESMQARFSLDQGTLAQIPGTSFYSRLRQKFGRLA